MNVPPSQDSHTLATLHVVAAILAGTAALLVLGLQPLLYGAYVKEGTIPDYRLGLLSAAELMAIAGGSGLAVKLLRSTAVLPVLVGGIALMVLGNLLNAGHGHAAQLFVYRVIAGSGAGLLVGLAAFAIATTSRVGFWAGLYLFGQATTQYGLMRWFAAYAPRADSFMVQQSLAAAAGLMLVTLPFLPRRLHAPALDAAPDEPRPTPRGMVGLAAMFLCVGGTGGIWGYLEVWLLSRHVEQALAVHLLSIGLLGQIVGSAVGAAIADGKFAWLRLLIVVLALVGVIMAWMEAPSSTWLAFGFGLAFMLGAPAFTSLLHALDPARGSVPYGATAQLSGLAVIPTIAGETLAQDSLTLVIWGCMAAIFVSAILIATQTPWLLRRRSPSQPRRRI